MINSGELDSMNPPKKTQSQPAPAKPVDNELSTEWKDRLKSIIASQPVMVFMKGGANAPRCKFSKAFVALMTEEGFAPGSYGAFNILEDEGVRQNIKVYSNWPTFPQLYVKSELIGGTDIIKELVTNSEFQEIFEGCI